MFGKSLGITIMAVTEVEFYLQLTQQIYCSTDYNFNKYYQKHLGLKCGHERVHLIES